MSANNTDLSSHFYSFMDAAVVYFKTLFDPEYLSKLQQRRDGARISTIGGAINNNVTRGTTTGGGSRGGGGGSGGNRISDLSSLGASSSPASFSGCGIGGGGGCSGGSCG